MSAAPLRPRRHPGIALDSLAPGASGRLTGICLDSRQILPGDLYVALPGQHVHGASFAEQAVERGALAILTDAAGAASIEVGVPVVVRPDPRAETGELAAAIYGRPSQHLEMFGVTGTNGKTSTVFLLEAGLAALGRRVATIGTIGFRIDGSAVATPRGTVTTPDAPDLQGMLGHMVEAGVDAVAMEVSSHALALHRATGIGFDVAAFTMLGQDHLDFPDHGRLLRGPRPDSSWADEPGLRSSTSTIRGDAWPTWSGRRTCPRGHDRRQADADYRVLDWSTPPDGSSSSGWRIRAASCAASPCSETSTSATP